MQNGLPHVDANFVDFIEFLKYFQCQDSGASLDFYFLCCADSVIDQIFGDTADPVSTHFRFASIRIEHPHSGVGNFGGTDQDQAIGTDSGMPIGDLSSDFGWVGRRLLLEAVNVDVVVSGAMHFGELHLNVHKGGWSIVARISET